MANGSNLAHNELDFVAATPRWLLMGAGFLLPLFFFWDTFDRFVLPKLLVARLLVIALAITVVLRGLWSGSWSWRRTTLDLPLIAFVGSSALSSAFAVNHNVALFGMYLRYEGLLTIATYAAIFWLSVQLLDGVDDTRAVGRGILAGAYFVSILAIVQSISGWGPGIETSTGGCVRAFATMGSPVELGTFLAMALPLALYEVLAASVRSNRVIAANVLVILVVALILTFTRAAWIAAGLGALIVLVVRRLPWRAWAAIAGATLVVVLAGIGVARLVGAASLAQCVVSRAQSVSVVSEGSVNFRLHVWADSLRLIPARPLVGSGPDSLALVYPSVQSGNWVPGAVIDKAHNETLQIAVTNGLLGVAAYVWVLLTFVIALWRGRKASLVVAMFAGLIAYEAALQAEFSWIPSAIPFWLFAALAFSITGTATARLGSRSLTRARAMLSAGIVVVGVAVALAAVVPDYQADRLFFRALGDYAGGHRDLARSEIASARQLNGRESLYAVTAGNFALDLDAFGRPGPRSNLAAARDAYLTAARLGTANPASFRDLALVDLQLGRRQEAIDAARRALDLNRFDPANAAVLRFVEGPPA